MDNNNNGICIWTYMCMCNIHIPVYGVIAIARFMGIYYERKNHYEKQRRFKDRPQDCTYDGSNR